MNFFDNTDYVAVIAAKISANSGTKGYRARLAEAVGFHGSYLSRVLQKSVHLTPDQAALLAGFWNLSADETDYFLTLVNLARAGTPRLRELLGERLANLRKKHSEVEHRLADSEVRTESHGLYYSAWHYGAIHMLLLLPGPHSVRSLARRLELEESVVESALETLRGLGVVKREGRGWVVQSADLHLSRKSPWAPVYQSNMRQRAAFRAFSAKADDLQYAALHAVSRKDFGRVKELLLESIEKIRAISGPSEAEDVFYVGLDAFRL